MKIEVILYIYGIVCISMIGFNVISNFIQQHRVPNIENKCLKLKMALDAEFKNIENNKNVYEILNLGESEPITLNQMIQEIENAVKKKAIIEKMPMQPGDVDRTYADISKAKKLV